MITLITLNDEEGTYIRTETKITAISNDFAGLGYCYIYDMDGREHIITPKCISYIRQIHDSRTACQEVPF